MKNLLGFLVVMLITTGCGTILEPKIKQVTINTETPSFAYMEDGTYIGKGKLFTIPMDNRSGRKNDYITLKEIGNENNIQNVVMERQFNGKSTLNFFIDFGIVSYPIDFANGGHKKLARTSYVVPNYSMKYQMRNTEKDYIDRIISNN